jgi:hypothetical protein
VEGESTTSRPLMAKSEEKSTRMRNSRKKKKEPRAKQDKVTPHFVCTLRIHLPFPPLPAVRGSRAKNHTLKGPLQRCALYVGSGIRTARLRIHPEAVLHASLSFFVVFFV